MFRLGFLCVTRSGWGSPNVVVVEHHLRTTIVKLSRHDGVLTRELHGEHVSVPKVFGKVFFECF